MKRKKCDKCGSKIKDGICDCGIWYEPEEIPEYIRIFELAMTTYDRMEISEPISSEKIVSGTCIVLFKGDYDMCEKVKKYIETL